MGVACSLYSVATTAAAQTVTASIAIHILAVPRVGRVWPAATATSDSAEEAKEVESFCQKSELAIRNARTSKFLQRLSSGETIDRVCSEIA